MPVTYNSSDVAALQDILATQYNTLRADVTRLATDHKFDDQASDVAAPGASITTIYTRAAQLWIRAGAAGNARIVGKPPLWKGFLRAIG